MLVLLSQLAGFLFLAGVMLVIALLLDKSLLLIPLILLKILLFLALCATAGVLAYALWFRFEDLVVLVLHNTHLDDLEVRHFIISDRNDPNDNDLSHIWNAIVSERLRHNRV